MQRRWTKVVVMLLLACILYVVTHFALGVPLPTWLRAIIPLDQISAGIEEPLAWSEAEAPNYYTVVGPAHIAERPDVGEIRYASLDALGRAGRVVACVDARLAEEGANRERQSTSGITPSGWGHNEKVDIELPGGGTYHGYLWNRSHLLAKSLGGLEIQENLVCGTRMQNVGANRKGSEGGMAYPETLVRNWLGNNPSGFVYYSATPCYRGVDLVCQSVVVDILSSDDTLDCEVVVYNAAKGYAINYADGSFTRA